MRESRAWRIVAEEFAAGRTARLICIALGNHRGNTRIKKIPDLLRAKMIDFVQSQLNPYSMYAYEYISPVSMDKAALTEQREARTTALLLFAEMAKEGATNA